MGKLKRAKETGLELARFFLPNPARIEELRTIISKEQEREVSFDEAQEIGTRLISFYEHLAGDLHITKGGLKNKKDRNIT